MRLNYLKKTLKTAALVASVLLLGTGMTVGHAQINLTAAPTTLTMPDGSVVPMWGYSCGAAGTVGTCAKLNPAAAGWSPVVITVPTGSDLTINLTNSLSFLNGNTVPTSIMIVGQVGGGLGGVSSTCHVVAPTTANAAGSTCTAATDHTLAQAATTWPIAGGAGTTPPLQGPRVQSFSTEVAASATAATLTWTAPRPGTYLLESGTHPSIQGPMGLYGIVVVTAPPAAAGGAYTAYPAVGTTPAVTYNAEVPLLFSEIDPVQNNTVSAAVNTAGFKETTVWSNQKGACGDPTATGVYLTCYPPAVNYTPLYYMINGVGFNKTSAATSLFAATAGTATTGITGNVLVRFVNAGLRMHVPAIVGSLTQGTTAAGLATPVAGFSLIAEDGNPLPGTPRVQSEVFMAAGKTYDVMINVPAAGGTALPVYDRELSLSGNKISRDAGMLAYIGINGAGLPTGATGAPASATPDSYLSLVPCAATPCPAFVVSDPGKGVIANDINVYGVTVLTAPTHGTLILNANGTFSYVPSAVGTAPDSFIYEANGNPAIFATVTLGAAPMEAGSGITVNPITYTSNIATRIQIAPSGVLSVDKDAAGYPLTVNVASATPSSGLTLTMDTNGDGGFSASVTTPGTYTFTYKAQNSQGTLSATAATVTLIFLTPSNLAVTVLDGTDKTTKITDYRWIIEEDRTFYVDPTKTTNTCPQGATCPVVPTFGTNFHTSYMPVVATGCTGKVSCEGGQKIVDPTTGIHTNAVCDLGNGVCRPDTAGTGFTAVLPGAVHLDPTKRYYITVLPGDAAVPFQTANASPGHGMGGAPITFAQTAVTIYAQPTPFPPSKLSVFVFEDDFPLNGEQDAGGGVDALSPNEPGLGGFNVTVFDDAGGPGDATGQANYDMFNQPLSNSLAGTIDPATGLNACPISPNERSGMIQDPAFPNDPTKQILDPKQLGITGTIVTCPTYESDGKTLSPMAGSAVVANMYPGRYGIVATPAADRIAKGEEWLQTNTLDGQKAHDSFLKIGEAGYFQEFGPAGYHVSIGFANPKIINSRLVDVCKNNPANPAQGVNCTNGIKGMVTTERMSRTPDERLYSSGDNSSFAFTQCYVSFGDPDGEDFAFTKCNSDGTFSLSGLPDGDWRVTVFDQWNDMLVDGLSTPVRLGGGKVTDLTQIAINQWQANITTTTFFDQNGNGVRTDLTGVACTGTLAPPACNANYGNSKPGLTLVATNVRFRDGSYSNFNNTDLSGNAGFNEEFPLFNWYVVETDSTRYKNTGTHVVYDAGGPPDGSTTCAGASGATPGAAPCGNSNIAHFLANTAESVPLPSNLRVPGAFYCANADCADAPATLAPGGTGGSTGRIDPPWVMSEGWQGFSGQNNFLEFGKKPFAVNETGGIRGEVIYASTRPFDDPALLIHTSWTPDVPGVTINLYQEGTAPDGSISLALVDTTKTSSFDDWAQGFRSDNMPNMNCPGQTTADLFYFTLYNQPNYLDVYNNAHNGTTLHTIPNNSQFKCYDGMHNWNQLQPAYYDGMYTFPSVKGRNPTTGNTTGTNCTICSKNTDSTDTFRFNKEDMLPAGKYVVEVVVPPGYELVKEEDKNILIGDNYIAPVTVQFPGLGGSIFILPDQSAVAAGANANNPQNPTQDLGRTTLPSTEADTGSVEQTWPCVGASRVVPDYISLFPGSLEVSPFAGATRNLCDRKEVTLDNQATALAKFYIFTSAHAAAHFSGVITDDFTSEFDPFSPQFGEKFAPPNLPISIKDWTGTETQRVYTDQWGAYNGLTYSTWEVNPPNPTGYSPQMMVTCMNDPGTGATPDALFNPAYSQFCYEIPFMPGQTQYMDTPVTPTSAFSDGYNHVDCAYPANTPAISEVDGDGIGPYVSAAGKPITIHALGDQTVVNNGYSGPAATAPPFNAKTITRNYGFGVTAGKVTIGGVTATITGWSPTTITATVPTIPSENSTCQIQQQAKYGGSSARCGQLVITAANGQQSIDAITVTVGGKAPTRVTPLVQMTQNGPGSIQQAIDAASPGDLIIVGPGSYNEMLLMWKPVRLQGVGAATSIINANTHPEGKLQPWRRQVDCLFGLALNGAPTVNPLTGKPNAYDPTGTYSCGSDGTTPWFGYVPSPTQPQVDRLPLEAVVGWDATLNGNLAELLQEPTLMGAYEGAAITVLSKGVDFHGGQPYAADTFPVGTTLLTANTCPSGTGTSSFPSSFWCNPSSIDGLGITNSSQGGGGIFVHAWGHNLQIANNRVINNTGTLSGGISVGQGEFPPQYIFNGGTPNADPGACTFSSPGTGFVSAPNNPPTNTQQPYCHNLYVNVHNNNVSMNNSIGDELFSATLAGVGGVTFCTGTDNYKFNYNWVCGNIGSGDGGGIGQMGFAYNGDIEHNSIIFNQSTNPTISTNGGGLLIMGAPDTDPVCAGGADADCPPGLSDGTGPGLRINANLIMGNAAESGSGGGVRLQGVNGTEITSFPNGNTNPSRWYTVTMTNNIITNNVAGWDGAGVSLQDALAVNFINNTVMSNDTTASAGPLFNTLGAPLASAGGPCPAGVTVAPGTPCVTTSTPQPAGFVSIQHSAPLVAALAGLPTVTCPAGHGSGGTGTGSNAGLVNGSCIKASIPILDNDVLFQNRAYYIGVGPLGTGALNQQNVVSLLNAFTGTPAASEPQVAATTPNGNGVVITGGTGACTTASYWDIGVRGDTGPANHAVPFRTSFVTLTPRNSVLTDAADYAAAGSHNSGANPTVLSQYCNGSRTPPEFKSLGYQVPPGISDATVPNPIFNLTPSATVDEGNNWVNISWGPLSMVYSASVLASSSTPNTILGNYALATGSPSIDFVPLSFFNSNDSQLAPTLSTDFNGNPRPATARSNVDVGAVEFQGPNSVATVSVSPTSLAFGNIGVGSTSAAQTLTLSNTGTATFTGLTVAVTAPFARAGGTCNTTLAAATTCTITVTFSPTVASTTPVTGTVTITGSVAVTGSPVSLSGTGIAAVISATLTPTSWTVAHVPNCPGTGFLGIAACLLDPAQVFTLTNTGNVPLTGIVQGTISGTNAPDFAVARLLSNCGPATGGQLAANVTLAPGATCTITVQFKPLTAEAVGTKVATLSVTDLAGTQTAALTGTENAPTLASIAPTSGSRAGANPHPITLTGTFLDGASAVTVSGTGVTCAITGTPSITTVTANCTITAAAATGARTVTVTTPTGTSNTVTFTVNP